MKCVKCKDLSNNDKGQIVTARLLDAVGKWFGLTNSGPGSITDAQ